MSNLFHLVGNTHFLERTLNPESWKQFVGEHFLDQFSKLKSWKILTNMDLKMQFHRLTIMRIHLTMWIPEGQVDLWMIFTTTKQNSDPAQHYSQHFRNQKEKESCVEESKDSNKENCAHHVRSRYGNNETYANNFSSPTRSGWLIQPILRTEELYHNKSPNRSQEWYVTTKKKTEKKMDHIIGTPRGRYCWRRLGSMEQKISQKEIGLSWIRWKEKEQSWRLCASQKNPCVTLETSSWTLWWYSDSARTDGIQFYFLKLDRVHLSKRSFVERSIYLREWVDSQWKTKRQNKANSLLHTSESFWWKSR